MRRIAVRTARCFYNAVMDFIKHDGVEHAGYLSFLAILSLFPFLVFLVSFFGFVGKTQFALQVADFMFENVPLQFTLALQNRIHEIVSGPPQGLLTLAIVGAIWTASSSVEGIRTVLNRAYRVETTPNYFLRRLFSIAEFFCITVALFIAMLAYALVPIIWDTMGDYIDLGFSAGSLETIRNGAAGIILMLGISLIYYMIPNCKQRFIAVLPGAVIVVIGWLVATNLLVFYISTFQQLNMIYGSLGSLIISLLFFYVLNMIFIFGAEFNYQLWQSRNESIDGSLSLFFTKE